MTQAGVLLGTAGYMSPEQARGKAVDRRADIWSFGCVLYEMLAGRRAFDGETVTDVLGAIVHKEPDLASLPAHVPPRIRQLLQQCLQKDASRRLQSIGDARVALQEWLENPKEAEPPAVAATPAGRRWLPWAAALVAGALGLLAGATLLGRRAAPTEPVRRFEINVTEDAVFSRLGSGLVASPDGRAIAYTTGIEGEKQKLVVRPLDRFQETVLSEGEGPGGPYHPFFSPDGDMDRLRHADRAQEDLRDGRVADHPRPARPQPGRHVGARRHASSSRHRSSRASCGSRRTAARPSP